MVSALRLLPWMFPPPADVLLGFAPLAAGAPARAAAPASLSALTHLAVGDPVVEFQLVQSQQALLEPWRGAAVAVAQALHAR